MIFQSYRHVWNRDGGYRIDTGNSQPYFFHKDGKADGEKKQPPSFGRIPSDSAIVLDYIILNLFSGKNEKEVTDMTPDEKKSNEEKERIDTSKSDSERRCCYVIDPCGCYVDPCGNRVTTCCY
jgi:hypothetical protein